MPAHSIEETSLLFVSDDGRTFSDRFGVREFKVRTLTHSQAVHFEQDLCCDALSHASVAVVDEFASASNPTDALRCIRDVSEIPIVWVSQDTKITGGVLALELGADDFVREPVNHREFAARIRVLLRRPKLSGTTRRNNCIVADDLELFSGERTALLGGSTLRLTRVEFDILHLLLQHMGTVVDRDTISRKVFGSRTKIRNRSIDVHLSCLRKKLGTRSDGQDRIRTIHGIGYIYAVGLPSNNIGSSPNSSEANRLSEA